MTEDNDASKSDTQDPEDWRSSPSESDRTEHLTADRPPHWRND